jgi:hypothetical protein
MTTREVFDRHLSHQLDGDLDAILRAHRDGKDELAGTDTFVIRDGLIQIHTFYATTPGLAA